MTTSPWTGFTELEESETIPAPVVVEMGRRIEAGANLYPVEDKDENDPPAVVADGRSYIIAATATGDWTGHEGKIATAVGTNAANGWLIRTVSEGVFAYVRDENKLYRYDGSAWGEYTAAVAGSAFEMEVAASDETTALTTGTAKVTFRMPRAVTITEVRASLSTAQTSGTTLKADVNEAGTSILGANKLTFDNGQKSTGTAAQSGITITTLSSVSDGSIADNAEMTIDIDAVGDGTAKGLKVTLIGTRV